MTSKEALQVMLEFTAPQGEKQHLECSEAYLKLNRDLEILEILKPYLKRTLEITEYAGGIELRFKPIAFGFGKIMNLDFDFNDTPQIKNIQKVKGWLDNDK